MLARVLAATSALMQQGRSPQTRQPYWTAERSETLPGRARCMLQTASNASLHHFANSVSVTPMPSDWFLWGHAHSQHSMLCYPPCLR